MSVEADRVRAAREALVRAHMADENRLDFDAVLATFPHPHYELVPTGEVIDGRAAVERYYAESRAAFPDQRNEIVALRHADDAVVVEFWLRGTHAGPFRGVPASGNAFACRMCAHFIFEGATLVCERVYFDAATLLRQLMGRVSPLRPRSILHALRLLAALKRA